MSRVEWSSFDYETGIDHAVFYPENSPGEVWNGIISVEEAPEEIGKRGIFLDGMKIAQTLKEAPFSAKISTYTNPVSWYDNLYGRRRKRFGFTYRTMDKIHIVYNAIAGPSETMYQYGDPGLYQWLVTTQPIKFPEGGFGSHLVIDGGISYPENITDLENILYGTETSDPYLPTPEEVLNVFEENSILRVIDNGDGTFTVIGPDDAITMLDPNTFEITWPSAVFKNIFEEEYTIRSL